MERPHNNEIPSFYRPYLALTKGNDIGQILNSAEKDSINLLSKLSEDQGEYIYDKDKWTIKEIIQHLIDAETVFTYRALWMARGSKEDLPGFDHDKWVINSKANRHSTQQLLIDFKTTRAFSISTFSKFTEKDFLQSCIVNGYNMTCHILPFLIAGHNLHHLNIIKERYL